MIRLFTLLFLGFASFCGASEEETEAPPLDPAYEGVHGMLLVNNKGSVFAYVMPSFEMPTDSQILYKVTPEGAHVRYLVRDADLVTIKPKAFNLEEMIRGNTFTIEADVYQGHFDRGGALIYENTSFVFDEQLYHQKIELVGPVNHRQIYDPVKVSSGATILIHRIRNQPSYDHLVLVADRVSCITDFTTSTAVPSESRLLNRLTTCGSLKPLYFETQDFQ